MPDGWRSPNRHPSTPVETRSPRSPRQPKRRDDKAAHTGNRICVPHWGLGTACIIASTASLGKRALSDPAAHRPPTVPRPRRSCSCSTCTPTSSSTLRLFRWISLTCARSMNPRSCNPCSFRLPYGRWGLEIGRLKERRRRIRVANECVCNLARVPNEVPRFIQRVRVDGEALGQQAPQVRSLGQRVWSPAGKDRASRGCAGGRELGSQGVVPIGTTSNPTGPSCSLGRLTSRMPSPSGRQSSASG